MRHYLIAGSMVFMLGGSCPTDNKHKLPEYDKIRDSIRIEPRDNAGIADLLEVHSYQATFIKDRLSPSQTDNVLEVINAAKIHKYDVHDLLAIAFKESSFHNDIISDTGDVGLFQVNYYWWGKKLGYKNFKEFYQGNIDPKKNAKHAIDILRIFSSSPRCKGNNLFACYNGGRGWKKSKNVLYITRYREGVVKTRDRIKRSYPEWAK